MKQRRAAAPYAKALFALAKQRNQTEVVGRELGDVAATFESDLDLRDFFARPWISAILTRAPEHESASWRGERRSRVLMTEHRSQWVKPQNSMRAPSSTTRVGGILKKSVAALALRAMKLNRRFRHRIIGAGPVGKSRALST